MDVLDGSARSRRRFLLSAGAIAATPMAAASAMANAEDESQAGNRTVSPDQDRDAPTVDERIGPRTIAEAEKLAQVRFSVAERAVIADTLSEQTGWFAARMAGEPLANAVAPGMIFDPRLPGMVIQLGPTPARWSSVDPGPLPEQDEAIAFAPVSLLSHWIRTHQLTSARLTEIYLDRLRRWAPLLECVVTLTDDLAMEQAHRADREIAKGAYRGPLHGIPWGAKDLLDTAGIETTWGATPYRDRVPTEDSTVVARLADAGAVLVAKLSLGALAYGDRWFGGLTRSPWDLEQGSSGSSAGSAAATTAGLVGFSIGTETYGSIVSPCMRCGATGLRPTFGRVARTGAMALCWSLDKIGPICRTVEDCLIVLNAINGADPGDASSLDIPLTYDGDESVRGLRIGYDPTWFEGDAVHELDRVALQTLLDLGMKPVELTLPDWPYETLLSILFAEAASAFEELTLSSRDDELVWQAPEAWPNMSRRSRFIPAIEFVQADRFRRQVMEMMAERFDAVDAIVGPSFAANLLLITNFTGHPSLTLRTGFDGDGSPRGITLLGHLFDEGTLGTIGTALERALDVWHVRPEIQS